MTGRRPGVERPQAREDGEADEYQREHPVLEMFRERILCQLKQAGGLRAGDDVGGHDPDQHHSAADERIEGQFHRAVLLAG